MRQLAMQRQPAPATGPGNLSRPHNVSPAASRNDRPQEFKADLSAVPAHAPASPANTGGLKRGITKGPSGEMLGGARSAGEAVGDFFRPVGNALENAFGAVVGALTGISISSNTNSPATWANDGSFDWRVGFSTTGRSGWLVQEITNSYRAEKANGQAINVPATPHYWEAWTVDAAGHITDIIGADNDYWIRPDLAANQAALGQGVLANNNRGHWSMKSSVYFTKTDPTANGLARNTVPDAGMLPSGLAAPPDLGIARLHRYAQGHWDSTVPTHTHTGMAGP
jgi:hypothetical protein